MDYYRKTDEFISKFNNGEDLYKNSPVFNVVIQQLVRGVDLYEVIGDLCQAIEDTQSAFNQYVIRN